jgi:type II secretory pathway component GspD/PulD (secretin)
MRALFGGIVLAACCVSSPLAQAQEAKPAKPANERVWSELIDAAAKELGISIVYDAGFAKERIAVSAGGPKVSARALLDQMLALHRMRLEVVSSAKVGRIMRLRTYPDGGMPVTVQGPGERPDLDGTQLVTRVVDLQHAEARDVMSAVGQFFRNVESEWVRSVDRDSIIVTATVARLTIVEQVNDRLDVAGPESEVAAVAPVTHGNAFDLASMINTLAPPKGEWVRARSNPAGTAVALVGQSRQVDQAKSLIASLDVPGADDDTRRLVYETRVIKLNFLDAQAVSMALRHMSVKVAIPVQGGVTVVLTGVPSSLDAAQAVIKQIDTSGNEKR